LIFAVEGLRFVPSASRCAISIRTWSRDGEKYFTGVRNVRISDGAILERSADAIVSPANSFGYMDGGTERFGRELQTRQQRRLLSDNDGELPVGQALVIETFDCRIPYLVSADNAGSHECGRHGQCVSGVQSRHQRRQAA